MYKNKLYFDKYHLRFIVCTVVLVTVKSGKIRTDFHLQDVFEFCIAILPPTPILCRFCS